MNRYNNPYTDEGSGDQTVLREQLTYVIEGGCTSKDGSPRKRSYKLISQQPVESSQEEGKKSLQ